jgi:hypothetical protein
MNLIHLIKNKINKKMETLTSTKGPKYEYNTELLAKDALTTIRTSLNKLANKSSFYYAQIIKNHFDADKDTFKQDKYTRYLFAVKDELTDEKFRKKINMLSKNGKKRINKLLIKLKAQPLNTDRVAKLWNKIEFLGGNHMQIKIGNQTEDQIATKRNEYKAIVKHIKMNLVEELKKARQEYIDTKGDYFKKKK